MKYTREQVQEMVTWLHTQSRVLETLKGGEYACNQLLLAAKMLNAVDEERQLLYGKIG